MHINELKHLVELLSKAEVEAVTETEKDAMTEAKLEVQERIRRINS